jgi:hypothetical protein
MLGLFGANAGFISQNFQAESTGSGSAPEAAIRSHLAEEAATDLLLATWGI